MAVRNLGRNYGGEVKAAPPMAAGILLGAVCGTAAGWIYLALTAWLAMRGVAEESAFPLWVSCGQAAALLGAGWVACRRCADRFFLRSLGAGALVWLFLYLVGLVTGCGAGVGVPGLVFAAMVPVCAAIMSFWLGRFRKAA